MNPADAYFEDLLARVVEGVAAEDEFATFAEIIRQEPALRQRYRREMRLHALLCCKGGLPVPKVAATGWWRADRPRFGFSGKRLAAAAAAALLLGAGIGLLRLVPPAAPMRSRTAAAHSAGTPVRLIRHSGAQGLELPAVLPGSVRLRQGVAVVRMPSGVELTLNGPLELAFASESGVEARLERGRLLAWVPPRAKGLIIRTRELEAWDIGTVFAVSADAAGSGVLVFKGRVQVMDRNGSAVGLCEKGEGAWAGAGESTVWKTSLDVPESRAAFASLQGYAALKAPVEAMNLAREIQETWVERFAPQDIARIRERRQRLAAERAVAERVPFSRKAWVRPTVPAKQEEKTMRTGKMAAVAATAVLLGGRPVSASSEPVAVNTSPTRNGYWSRICTNAVPLSWEWREENAVRAELTLTGLRDTRTVALTPPTTNWIWQVSAAPVPAEEDVVDLTLRFYDAQDVVTSAHTSRLSVVSGAFGTTPVVLSDTGKRWTRVRDAAVIPYDACWAEATAPVPTGRLVIARQNGLTQTNLLPDAAGFYGWKLRGSSWGYGTFSLALDFPERDGVWPATLFRVAEGFIIQLH